MERVGISEFISLFPDIQLLFDYFKDKILVEKEVYNGKDYYWLTIETRWEREYVIRVNICDDGSVYFGGWSESRLVLPFETWHRGNDFPDGKLNDHTIQRFLRAVVDDIFVNVPNEKPENYYKQQETPILDDVKVQLDK